MIGPIPDVPIGSVFDSRAALSLAGVHRPRQAGICGSVKNGGAESIVLNGGYIDDEDYGTHIVYTGHGGNDPSKGRQVADKVLTVGNAALALSVTTGGAVRVIRGFNNILKSGAATKYAAPVEGYRYDGLYVVEEYWKEKGRDGYDIWRFRLRESESLEPVESIAAPAPRASVTIQRFIRSTTVASQVKAMYGSKCQVCCTKLETPAGPYAEGAHIVPLGRPFDGPDEPGNVLCLCPNCHVLFDYGGIIIGDNLSIVGKESYLTLHPEHELDLSKLAAHRLRFT
jgi:putative restriction endonuclease